MQQESGGQLGTCLLPRSSPSKKGSNRGVGPQVPSSLLLRIWWVIGPTIGLRIEAFRFRASGCFGITRPQGLAHGSHATNVQTYEVL